MSPIETGSFYSLNRRMAVVSAAQATAPEQKARIRPPCRGVTLVVARPRPSTIAT